MTVKMDRRRRYILASTVASVVVAVAFVSALASNPYKASRMWNFDSASDAAALEGFLQSAPSDMKSWKIVPDASAPSVPNVLLKSSGGQVDPGYHVLIMPDGPFETNYKADVKFRFEPSGHGQETAGLVVRLQDESHYFILMADYNAQRFSLCRAEPGLLVCTQDKSISISDGQWHSITAQVSAQGIAGYLDGKLLLQRYDQHYVSGTIGVMTKDSTSASFDDLSIQY